MAMKFLKKQPLGLMPGGSLKFLLHQHLSGKDAARPLFRIHASELTKEGGLCPRYYALHDATKLKPKDGWLTTAENVTFHLGRIMQDSVVNWFADMGKAVGHWKCVSCGHMHQFQLRPNKCETCGGKKFDPEEVRFESAVCGASCGVDMLVKLDQTKLTVCELKTIRPEDFKTLLAPLAEHRLRTNLYLRLIEESDTSWSQLVDVKKAKILYVSKGGWGTGDQDLKAWGLKGETFSPFKEFDIDRDDKQTDALVERARIVKEFRQGAIGMPSGVCPTALAKRATHCSRKAECFSGEHPPEFTWKA